LAADTQDLPEASLIVHLLARRLGVSVELAKAIADLAGLGQQEGRL
jgi:hypothetical protein